MAIEHDGVPESTDGKFELVTEHDGTVPVNMIDEGKLIWIDPEIGTVLVLVNPNVKKVGDETVLTEELIEPEVNWLALVAINKLP